MKLCSFTRIFSFAAAVPLALFHSTDRDSRCSPKFPEQQALINLSVLLSQNNTGEIAMLLLLLLCLAKIT